MIHCLVLFSGLLFCSTCVVISWAHYQNPEAKLVSSISSPESAEGRVLVLVLLTLGANFFWSCTESSPNRTTGY